MEVGYRETESRRWLESSGRCVHSDRGWREGVVWREDERAPVLAAMVWRVLRTRDDVVPSKLIWKTILSAKKRRATGSKLKFISGLVLLQNIGFRGMRCDVGRRSLRDGLELAGQLCFFAM